MPSRRVGHAGIKDATGCREVEQLVAGEIGLHPDARVHLGILRATPGFRAAPQVTTRMEAAVQDAVEMRSFTCRYTALQRGSAGSVGQPARLLLGHHVSQAAVHLLVLRPSSRQRLK